MTIAKATFYLLNNLRKIYSEGESSQITDWVMENLTGSKKAERMIYKNSALTNNEEMQIMNYTERLLQHEPVQYILNESWFCGMKFYVDKHVLIPRPETEELVEWIINDVKSEKSDVKILDVGTGSGCIPISLKKKIPHAEITSCDSSESALSVAKKNATAIETTINFRQLDFLNKENWSQVSSFDIIVSNPPYIPEKNKAEMQANVINYEPAIALFVPDNDPLLFYKAIAEFGKIKLNKNGSIYVEIHEDLGESVQKFFEENNYSVELKKDLQGKDRMIKAKNNY